jgi:hypothetical protein
MRIAPVLAAVAIGTVAVISGCGQQHPGTSAPSASALTLSSATAHNGAGAASACHGIPLQSVVFIRNRGG